jgi:hypothetical protein
LKLFFKYLGKSLKILIVAGLTLLILVVGGVLTLLKWPQILINPKVLHTLTTVAGQFGYIVNWERSQLEIKSFGWLHKSIDLKFENFCFNFPSPTVAGCMDHLQIAGEFSYRPQGFRVLSLGPILVENGKLALHQNEAEKQVASRTKELFGYDLPDLLLPKFLRSTKFYPIKIDLKNLTVWSKDTILLVGRLQLNTETTEMAELKKAELKLQLEPGYKTPTGQVTATVVSPSHFLQNDWNLQLQTKLETDQNQSIQAKLEGNQTKPQTYQLQGNIDFSTPTLQAKTDWKGTLGRGELSMKVGGQILGLNPQLENISFSDCQLQIIQPSVRSDQLKTDFSCPLLIDLKNIRLPDPAFEKFVKIPSQGKIKVEADLDAKLFPDLDRPVSGNLKIQFDTLEQELLKFSGNIKTEFSGVPKNYPEDWILESEADLSILMAHFQKLVTTLNHSAFAIPAPFRVLDGTVELKLKGDIDLAQNRGTVPVEFKTELASNHEKFNTEGKGELAYEFSKTPYETDLIMDILFTEVSLQLPRFRYESIPTLLPDSRYYDPNHPPSTKEPTSFKYQINIGTPEGQPARLYSNLAKEFIPIALDLQLTPEKVDGIISIQNGKLAFFRRNATITKFSFDFEEPIEKSVIDGDIKISYADYDINILVIGSIERPQIIFQSSPPLDQEQIISVLIYGRTFEDLNSDESNTVSSVSGAAADRAMTLGSLFLLASTPIESVSYNAATRAFTAKIRVAKGTSLSLGTQEGKTQQTGLQQNLGGNWNLNTYFENDSQTGEQRGGGIIEWYKRY